MAKPGVVFLHYPLLVPFFRIGPGTAIGGNYALIGGLTVFPPGIQPLTMAAYGNPDDVRRIDGRGGQGFLCAGAVMLPQFF